ncbi:MAG TPA: T9SS type A sorting domain-containing protein [Bacteroidota bacterium]|nr:T9SS type A sorting domain-containing protein [Bacteroidota bacterium]
MTIRHIAILLLLGLLIPSSFCLLAQTDSCGITWDNIIQISHDTSFSVVPRVVATGDTIHILWFGTELGNGEGIQYSHSFDGGQTFSPQTQLVSYDSARGNRGLLAASGSHLCMVYHALVDSPAYSNLGILCSINAGVSWQPRVIIGEYALGAVAARDSNVYVYVNYSVAPGVIRGGLIASHDCGNTWNMVNDALPVQGGNPSIVVTSVGMHIVRTQAIVAGDQEVFYLRSTDFGLTWSVQETLSVRDGITSDQPVMAADDSGNIYVAWRDGKYGSIDGFHASVILRKSSDNGTSWGGEQLLTSTPTALRPRISRSNAKIVVAWNEYVDYYTDRPFVRLSTNEALSWCDTTSAGSFGIGVDISLENELLHLVWSNDAWVPDGDVFYQRGTIGGPVFVREGMNPKPNEYQLEQNYPNPFNSRTIIKYSIPHRDRVSIRLYDLLGRIVETLYEGNQEMGNHVIDFDSENLSSGVYLLVLEPSSYSSVVRKLMIIK